MGLMILTGARSSAVLAALLVAVLGLTFWETREHGLDRRSTTWWLLLALLIHAPAYLALRIWSARRTADR